MIITHGDCRFPISFPLIHNRIKSTVQYGANLHFRVKFCWTLTCWVNPASAPLGLGSVTNFQSIGESKSHMWNQGTLALDGCSPPASSSSTLQPFTSESLPAITEPAVPAPTGRKEGRQECSTLLHTRQSSTFVFAKREFWPNAYLL